MITGKLLGFTIISKETDNKLWARGAIWETSDEKNKFVCLCGDCSAKELKQRRPPTDLELEKIYDELEKQGEVIEHLTVPDKFKDTLFTEEIDYQYRLRPNALMVCEKCGKMVI